VLAALVSLAPAFPAGAVVVDGPIADGTPASPLGYMAAVMGGDLKASQHLLNDDAAMNWLGTHRPAQFELVVARAHQLAEAAEVLKKFEGDQISLRRAVIARQDLPFFKDARGLEEFATNHPEILRDPGILRIALMSWKKLGETVGDLLRAKGWTEASWTKLAPFQRSAEIVSALYEAKFRNDPQGKSRARAMKDFSREAAPYMDPRQAESLQAVADQEERRFKALEKAREEAGALSGSELTAQAFVLSDDQARERALETVASRLGSSLSRAVAGTSAATLIDPSHPSKFKFAPYVDSARYSPEDDAILVGEESAREFLHARGRTFADLVAEPGLLDEFVLFISPHLVREAVRRREDLTLTRRGLDADEKAAMQSHGSEDEAFAFMSAFVQQKSAQPGFAEKLAEWKRNPALSSTDETWGSGPLEGIPARLERFHAFVAGASGARARTTLVALRRTKKFAGLSPTVLTELARRRSLPVVERVRLEKEGAMDLNGDVGGMKTSALRLMLELGDQALHLVYHGMLDSFHELEDMRRGTPEL